MQCGSQVKFLLTNRCAALIIVSMLTKEVKQMLENIGLEIRILSNLIYHRMNQRTMEAENISVHQCLILQHLTQHPGQVVCQKDIEQLFSIRRSTANQMLRALEERRLIRRFPSAEDARKNIIEITDEGSRVCEALNESMKALLDELLHGIDRAELAQFQATLRKLWHNIE